MSHSHQQPPKPFRSMKSSALNGHIRVPGDKSISHRSLMFGALATGQTRISGLLEGADVIATAHAVRAMGAHVEKRGADWIVTGCGIGGLKSPEAPLDFGNAGTGSRLMMGVVAGNPIQAKFIGDASLSRRPMGRILDPLKQMGLQVINEEGDADKFPLILQGTNQLIPITYELPIASAQIKSAILLAGLHAHGDTSVIEPVATRDHTERLLAHFGAKITVNPHGTGKIITVHGPAELSGHDILVPGDPSSAAFLAAAALITRDSEILIEGVLINPTRFGFYQTLLEMGANITLQNERIEGGEPVADLHVRSSRLKGVDVPPERAPSMIDEYPCLSILAAFAQGETRMRGLHELRVKESDRLAATSEGLSACGIANRIEQDDLIVQGHIVHGQNTVRGGGMVKTELDHRIAMSFLILGLATEQPVSVDDVTMIETSFPQFTELLTGLGARFESVKE